MMLLLVAAAAAAAVSTANSTPYSDDWPPTQFQGDATVTVQFTDQPGIERACEPMFGRPPEGLMTRACATGRRVVMPNPCRFARQDEYARLLCHELGHVNGWSRAHGPGIQSAAGDSAAGAAAEARGGR